MTPRNDFKSTPPAPAAIDQRPNSAPEAAAQIPLPKPDPRSSARGEFSSIRSIRERLGPTPDHVLIGIGDDAAVVQGSSLPLLICSDAMVEGVHFDLDLIRPRQLGYKAVMACASDIAAMNGSWKYGTISLALPKAQTETPEFLNEFYDGVREACEKCGAHIVGGDLASSPQNLFIDVTCIGHAANAIGRGGARIDDWIAVSGQPGASAAGLDILKRRDPSLRARFPKLVCAHLEPEARFDLLTGFSEPPRRPTSMIDLSDGLSSELHHLQETSGLGFEITLDHLPDDGELTAAAQALAAPDSQRLEWVLNGGEDYQLLATFDPGAFLGAGTSAEIATARGWTLIGRVIDEPGVFLVRENKSRYPLPAKGYRHF